jgi:uncharacterized glyoxalase superfamily protein PhnB
MAGAPSATQLLRYRDPDAAANWLCRAFGFERRHVSKDGGEIRYITLSTGQGCILVCGVTSSVLGDFMVQPHEIGGGNTQISYLVVRDVLEHSQRAKTAGAKVETGPEDDGDGGHFYACRDLEDHLWSFGTRAYSGAEERKTRRTRRVLGHGAAFLLGLVLAAGGMLLHRTSAPTAPQTIAAASAGEAHSSWKEPPDGAQYREAAVRADEAWQREQTARQQVQEELQRAQAELPRLLQAKEEAESAWKASEARLQSAQRDLEQSTSVVQRVQAEVARAEAKAADVMKEMAGMRSALEAAEKQRSEIAAASSVERDLVTRSQRERDALRADVLRLEAGLAAERQARQKAQEEGTLLREDIARLQRSNLADSEQLQEVRAAMLVAQAEIARLSPPPLLDRAVKTEDRADAAADTNGQGGQVTSVCSAAVQRQLPAWDAASRAKLCRGAEGTPEPAGCVGRLMSGTVSWGGGTAWMPTNALTLCAGTPNAKRTLDCFASAISEGRTWQAAIARCRSGKG